MGQSDNAISATPEPAGLEASDGSLLQRFRRGSEDAATQLYLRYATRLHALARGQCSGEMARRIDAEDIVQSVFRLFFHGARQGFYEVPAGEDLWKLLLVIALNKIRAECAFHRAAKRDVRRTASVTGLDLEPARDAVTEEFLQLAVSETLDQMDAGQRALVELRIQGHDIAAIARIVGRSKRSIERKLQEIRKKLTRLLQQES
jgi:RNA polymerase sigma-70 factor (ECF subfamily)